MLYWIKPLPGAQGTSQSPGTVRKKVKSSPFPQLSESGILIKCKCTATAGGVMVLSLSLFVHGLLVMPYVTPVSWCLLP